MTGYLDHVVRRGGGDIPTVLPRPRSRYEPSGAGLDEVPDDVDATSAWPDVEPAAAIPGGAAAASGSGPADAGVDRAVSPLPVAPGGLRGGPGPVDQVPPGDLTQRAAVGDRPTQGRSDGMPGAVTPGGGVPRMSVPGGRIPSAGTSPTSGPDAPAAVVARAQDMTGIPTPAVAVREAGPSGPAPRNPPAPATGPRRRTAAPEVEVRVDRAPEAGTGSRPGTVLGPSAAGARLADPHPPGEHARNDRPPRQVAVAPVGGREPPSGVPALPDGPAPVDVDSAPRGASTLPDAGPGPRVPSEPGRTAPGIPTAARAGPPPLPVRAAGPSQRIGQARANDRPPTVTVTIGRVEVRRPEPPPLPPPVPELAPAGPQPLTLAEYLDRRGRT